jgi:hypothetical protein
MNLTNAIVGLQQAQLTSQIQIAVAKKILDVEQTNGGDATELLDSAEQGFSRSADALATLATKLGGNLDVTG